MVRTRIAPSPTGFAHLGFIYQALFYYIFAHKYKGKFVLRIEDTDRSRLVEGAEKVLVDSLHWVHLDPDEGVSAGGTFGPYRQSERLSLYQTYANELIEKGHAYRCFCTKERLAEMRKSQEASHLPPKYDRTCLRLSPDVVQKNLGLQIPFVVRMKIPDDTVISFDDAIVGKVQIQSKELDDQVILKSDGFPTYHLAVVVDDYTMKITHIFRGTEWIPSTPKHILLWEFLGWKDVMPHYAHVPLLLNTEGGGKLSKRHGHASVEYYRTEGFLPEAILNYLANVVWNHPDGKEIFPIEEFEKAFSLDPFQVAVKPNGAKFDLVKLAWINGTYIREILPENELLERLLAFDEKFKHVDQKMLTKLLPLAKTRAKTLKELAMQLHPFLVQSSFTVSNDEQGVIKMLVEQFTELNSWQADTIFTTMKSVMQAHKITIKKIYSIFTGSDSGLPLPQALEIIGKKETLARLSKYLP